MLKAVSDLLEQWVAVKVALWVDHLLEDFNNGT
jgi:hypothetical protein